MSDPVFIELKKSEAGEAMMINLNHVIYITDDCIYFSNGKSVYTGIPLASMKRTLKTVGIY